jgi:hypothetical protein
VEVAVGVPGRECVPNISSAPGLPPAYHGAPGTASNTGNTDARLTEILAAPLFLPPILSAPTGAEIGILSALRRGVSSGKNNGGVTRNVMCQQACI